jgi:hypothetical protein
MSRIAKTVTAHESIVAMVGELPMPGAVWLPADRAKWLKAFTAICDFIYEDDYPAQAPDIRAAVQSVDQPGESR